MNPAEQSDKPVTSAREEFKRQKQLERARREGKLPPELDEHGQEISPYIPNYIAKAPWYASLGDNPSLRHQKSQNLYQTNRSSSEHHERIILESTGGTKYQKGACENCGAITHSRRDCIERPRKIGAKWSGLVSDSVKEVVIKEAKLDFEGKRDRWAGYDAASYQEDFLEEWSKLENSRQREKIQKDIDKKIKLKNVEKGIKEDNDTNDNVDQEEYEYDEDEGREDDLYADKTQVPEHKFPDPYTRVAAKNLRIREDTVKYLKDLNSDLPYNPKSRSMRERTPRPLKRISRITKDNLSQVVKQITSHNQLLTLPSEKKESKELEKWSWESTLPKEDPKLSSIANPTMTEEGKKKLIHKETKEKQDRDSMIKELYGESPNVKKGSAPDDIIY